MEKRPARLEYDLLGEREIGAGSLSGIHTLRAKENFCLSAHRTHPALLQAFGLVKLACVQANHAVGCWADEGPKVDALMQACFELSEGKLIDHIELDALQGGAGTSTNMAVNEVIANRALQLLGDAPGNYTRLSPIDDVNRHQSTNDTYPTALRLAAIRLLKALEQQVTELQQAFQEAEQKFAHVVKIGRTEMMDAVLTTLGREMGAYAEALSRDRWRIYKCEERLRVVNLGGTAIGTGLGAPRSYIFQVVEKLREVTGIGFARAENLVESTQNSDVFVEVSGILKALATNLIKISDDLRLMSSGPDAGLGEIHLPAVQVGSSIMPAKVNPVIPEAVGQIGMLYLGYDQTIAVACSRGNLELNPYLPLVAHLLLDGLEMLTNACSSLRSRCVSGIEANEARCRSQVLNSTALATVLVPVLGYEAAVHVAALSQQSGRTIRTVVLEENLLDEARFDELISPEAVCRLGSRELQR
jgi:aspartate ammonia-lyase